MMIIKYRLDEHNIVYTKLKRMHKELKELLDCVEGKMDEEEEYEEEEEPRSEFRRSMRETHYSEPETMYRRSGRYGYRTR